VSASLIIVPCSGSSRCARAASSERKGQRDGPRLWLSARNEPSSVLLERIFLYLTNNFLEQLKNNECGKFVIDVTETRDKINKLTIQKNNSSGAQRL
jgi:hypothetical protein